LHFSANITYFIVVDPQTDASEITTGDEQGRHSAKTRQARDSCYRSIPRSIRADKEKQNTNNWLKKRLPSNQCADRLIFQNKMTIDDNKANTYDQSLVAQKLLQKGPIGMI